MKKKKKKRFGIFRDVEGNNLKASQFRRRVRVSNAATNKTICRCAEVTNTFGLGYLYVIDNTVLNSGQSPTEVNEI